MAETVKPIPLLAISPLNGSPGFMSGNGLLSRCLGTPFGNSAASLQPNRYRSFTNLPSVSSMEAMTNHRSDFSGHLDIFPTPVTASSLLQKRRRMRATESPENSEADSSPTLSRRVSVVPDEQKDDAYWERRRKNNEAAKRSRDVRRRKEDDIATRAALLEQENLRLRAEVTILKQQTSHLHLILLQQAQRVHPSP